MNLAFGFRVKIDGQDTEIFYSFENNQLLSDMFSNNSCLATDVYHLHNGRVVRHSVNFQTRTVTNLVSRATYILVIRPQYNSDI
jgi:hypothetical protein